MTQIRCVCMLRGLTRFPRMKSYRDARDRPFRRVGNVSNHRKKKCQRKRLFWLSRSRSYNSHERALVRRAYYQEKLLSTGRIAQQFTPGACTHFAKLMSVVNQPSEKGAKGGRTKRKTERATEKLALVTFLFLLFTLSPLSSFFLLLSFRFFRFCV